MKQGMEKRAKHQQSILKQKTNDISSLTESAIL
jgi:WD40 repeat protein